MEPLTERRKHMPQCKYRLLQENRWTKILALPIVRAYCGEEDKIPQCTYRDESGHCKILLCLKDYDFGCCYYCPLSKTERMDVCDTDYKRKTANLRP
jgi:hypothetical protein